MRRCWRPDERSSTGALSAVDRTPWTIVLRASRVCGKASQPKGGFSTLEKRGGGFNMSKPKSYIEEHVHSKKDVPCPGSSQPKGGFSTLETSGGNFNMSKPKSYIEEHVHNKKDVPDPGRRAEKSDDLALISRFEYTARLDLVETQICSPFLSHLFFLHCRACPLISPGVSESKRSNC